MFTLFVALIVALLLTFAKYTLSDKVIFASPCPEMRTLTNGNGRYIMKLNYCSVIYTFYQWRIDINIDINKKANLSRFH